MAIILTDKQVLALIKKELEARNYATKDDINKLQTSINEINNKLDETTDNANIAREENFAQQKAIEVIISQLEPINLNKVNADTVDGLHIRLLTNAEFEADRIAAEGRGEKFPPNDTIFIFKDEEEV